jgi:hypothetical protein
MSRLTESKIPDEKIGYYKNLVYKDWISDTRLSQFDFKYRSYICAILNALKNKRIKGSLLAEANKPALQGRVNFS